MSVSRPTPPLVSQVSRHIGRDWHGLEVAAEHQATPTGREHRELVAGRGSQRSQVALAEVLSEDDLRAEVGELFQRRRLASVQRPEATCNRDRVARGRVRRNRQAATSPVNSDIAKLSGHVGFVCPK